MTHEEKLLQDLEEEKLVQELEQSQLVRKSLVELARLQEVSFKRSREQLIAWDRRMLELRQQLRAARTAAAIDEAPAAAAAVDEAPAAAALELGRDDGVDEATAAAVDEAPAAAALEPAAAALERGRLAPAAAAAAVD